MGDIKAGIAITDVQLLGASKSSEYPKHVHDSKGGNEAGERVAKSHRNYAICRSWATQNSMLSADQPRKMAFVDPATRSREYSAVIQATTEAKEVSRQGRENMRLVGRSRTIERDASELSAIREAGLSKLCRPASLGHETSCEPFELRKGRAISTNRESRFYRLNCRDHRCVLLKEPRGE